MDKSRVVACSWKQSTRLFWNHKSLLVPFLEGVSQRKLFRWACLGLLKTFFVCTFSYVSVLEHVLSLISKTFFFAFQALKSTFDDRRKVVPTLCLCSWGNFIVFLYSAFSWISPFSFLYQLVTSVLFNPFFFYFLFFLMAAAKLKRSRSGQGPGLMHFQKSIIKMNINANDRFFHRPTNHA